MGHNKGEFLVMNKHQRHGGRGGNIENEKSQALRFPEDRVVVDRERLEKYVKSTVEFIDRHRCILIDPVTGDFEDRKTDESVRHVVSYLQGLTIETNSKRGK
jgi:hypothetical protein